MPAINPEILVWARETAGLTLQDAVAKVGIKDARGVAAVDRLTALERGEEKPTRPVLVSMAHHYRRPLLAFYLNAPPRRDERGPDFRTLPGARSSETDALIDALVRNLQTRQNMVRAALQAEDKAEPLLFVGALLRDGDADTGIHSIRRVLRRKTEAARLSQRAVGLLGQVLGQELDAARYYAEPTADDSFRLLRSRTEVAGVFVLLQGDLRSHHTGIDVEVFRGLAIADNVGPFVVINDNDSRAAWSFTLLHELTHLLLGQTGFSGADPETEVEQFCNNVAAEWLVPARTLDAVEIGRGRDVVEHGRGIGKFARERNLSRTMVAYRLLRANRIDRQGIDRQAFEPLPNTVPRAVAGVARPLPCDGARVGGRSQLVRRAPAPAWAGAAQLHPPDGGLRSTVDDLGGKGAWRQARAGWENAPRAEGAVGRSWLLYLLDANVLIDANRDHHPIRRVPEFWDWLVARATQQQVKIAGFQSTKSRNTSAFPRTPSTPGYPRRRCRATRSAASGSSKRRTSTGGCATVGLPRHPTSSSIRRRRMARALKAKRDVTAIEEGKLLDYITGKPIKDNAKEQVRQRIARALFHEYGISLDDMEPDFKLKVDGRNKKIDIAVFEHEADHSAETIRRIVICQKEPSNGRKSAYKMRDHEQAQKEFGLLHAAMTEAPSCRYGLWTNGLEFFFFEREQTRFDVKFKPIGDWPLSDESIGTRDVVSTARMRRASANMLRTAFRRCHNFIHGNEGMPKDAAFWQFLYLIFAKMHDEKRERDEVPRFWAGPTEQFDAKGRKAIRARIEPLFDEVKRNHSSIFRGNEEITLSDRALAFMVSELAKYDFGRTDVDAKGTAYQEIVEANLRGDRGQYFTPRGAIKLMVEMLDPKPDERVLDPACGTGGFLIATLDYLDKRFHNDAKVEVGVESTEEFLSLRDRLAHFARTGLLGADFDPFLVRAAQMNIVMASNADAPLFNMNSLEFPTGHLSGVKDAKKHADLGTMDVVMTNPPFGSDIPVTDPNILQNFDLAHVWERTEDGAFKNSGRVHGTVSPEVLFIERCVEWLKSGGRMGIVLPDGILGNPGDEYIRWWILRHCWVLASVDLPVEVFIVEANVNILTSLLFLKKKSQQEIQATDLGAGEDYPVFMAVAEKVGYDRRGNTIYERSPDGEEILVEEPETESIRISGRVVTRTFTRKKKVVDNDLPKIGEAYAEFRRENREPGS